MEHDSSAFTLLSPFVPRARMQHLFAQIESIVGPIQSVNRVSGGLVHFVFSVAGQNGRVFLKIRGRFYAEVPDITTNPAIISDEYRALMLYSQVLDGVFPTVLLFDPNLHYILLSDVMPDNTTLADKYVAGKVSPSDLFSLGATLGRIHLSLAQLDTCIRTPDDTTYRNRVLEYVFERYDHPLLQNEASRHRDREDQLIIGDLSPKNIRVADGRVTLCDLENAHRGSRLYDLAYLLAHVMLHSASVDQAIAASSALLDGYIVAGAQLDKEDDHLLITTMAIFLYRLDNPKIPYNLGNLAARRTALRANAFRLLERPPQAIRELIVRFLTLG
jgi:5-methylthioribose kinase